MSIKSRRVLIFFLLIMILGLAGVSAFIALRLREDESAKDTSADTSGCCLNNCLCTCWDGVGDEYREAHCQLCQQKVYDSTTQSCVGSGTPGTGGCTDGRTASYCTTWNCPNGDTDGNGQCTAADNGASYTGQSGTSCGSPASGCGQVDYYTATPVSQADWTSYYCGRGLLNLSNCGGDDGDGDGDGDDDNKAVCGQPCTSNSDCIDYGSGGDRVECIGKKCSNPLCPGNEEKGTICNCLGIASCGEFCGYGAAGLCEDGLSSCRFLSESCPTGTQKAVCYPVERERVSSKYYSAAFDAEWDSLGKHEGGNTVCTTGDDNSWIRQKNPTTGATIKTSFTRAEIAALCKWCGNYKLESGEECDPPGTVVNGRTCRADCTLPASTECGDGIIDPGEECDSGDQNGVLCTSPYGSTCNYCSATCTLESVEGPFCGDGKVNGSEVCDPLASQSSCPNGTNCTGQCTCSSLPQVACGGSCTTIEQCPTNHTCTGGRCVRNGCTSSTCVNNCIPLCGGPCATNSDCPANHQCDQITDTCKLTACLNNNSCVNNGCTLPNTALFEDSKDYLILGLLLVSASLLVYQVNLVPTATRLFIHSRFRFILSSLSPTIQKQSFEKKVDQSSQNKKS